MRFSIRYDDEAQPAPNATRKPDLCNIDLYVNTQDELVSAQHLINGVLAMLPRAADGGSHDRT